MRGTLRVSEVFACAKVGCIRSEVQGTALSEVCVGRKL